MFIQPASENDSYNEYIFFNFLKRLVFLKILFIYSWQTEKEAETQAEGEEGSMQGARCGTISWDSRITPWAEGGAKLLSHLGCPFFKFFKYFIYLFMKDTEREREADTQAEGEAGSTQGARRGTWSQVSRITPWAEGGAKLLSHWGCLKLKFLKIATKDH